MRLRFEKVTLPAETRSVTIRAVVGTLEYRQRALFETNVEAEKADAFSELIERLGSRMGEKRVLRPHLRPEAQPEHAWGYAPWVDGERGGVSPPVRNPQAKSTRLATIHNRGAYATPLANHANAAHPSGTDVIQNRCPPRGLPCDSS